MPPEDKCCEHPETCPPVLESKLRWEQVKEEYQEVKNDLKEVGANVSQTNIHLAEQGVRLDNIVRSLDKYSKKNTDDHDYFYEKDREARERLTKIETAQAIAPSGAQTDSNVMERLHEIETKTAVNSAVKLDFWMLIKLIGGFGLIANLGDIVNALKDLF